MYKVRCPSFNSAQGRDGLKKGFAVRCAITTGRTSIQSMLHHRRQHGLDVINEHMVTPFKQRPSPGSLQETLTGPWGKTGMALSTHLNQIEDVVNQQLRAVLKRTTLLQLLQRLGAKPGQAFGGWIKANAATSVRMHDQEAKAQAHQKAVQLGFGKGLVPT